MDLFLPSSKQNRTAALLQCYYTPPHQVLENKLVSEIKSLWTQGSLPLRRNDQDVVGKKTAGSEGGGQLIVCLSRAYGKSQLYLLSGHMFHPSQTDSNTEPSCLLLAHKADLSYVALHQGCRKSF